MNCFYKINDWFEYLRINFKGIEKKGTGHPFHSLPKNHVAWNTLAGFITHNLQIDPESREGYKELARIARYETDSDAAVDKNNLELIEAEYLKNNWDGFIALVNEIVKNITSKKRESVLSLNKYFFYWVYNDVDSEVGMRDVKNYADDETNNFFAFVKMIGGAMTEQDQTNIDNWETNISNLEAEISKLDGYKRKHKTLCEENNKKIEGIIKDIEAKTAPAFSGKYDTVKIKLYFNPIKFAHFYAMRFMHDESKTPVFITEILKDLNNSKFKFDNTLFKKRFNKAYSTHLNYIDDKLDIYKSDKESKEKFEEYKKSIKALQLSFDSLTITTKEAAISELGSKWKIEPLIDGLDYIYKPFFIDSKINDFDSLKDALINYKKKYNDINYQKTVNSLYKKLIDEIETNKKKIADLKAKEAPSDSTEDESEIETINIETPPESPPKVELSGSDETFLTKISNLMMFILDKFNTIQSEELIKEYGHQLTIITFALDNIKKSILTDQQPDKVIFLKKLTENMNNKDLENIYDQLSLKLWPKALETGFDETDIKIKSRSLTEYCITNDQSIFSILDKNNDFFYNFELKKGLLVWSRPNTNIKHANFFDDIIILKKETIEGKRDDGIIDSIDSTNFFDALTKISNIKVKTSMTNLKTQNAKIKQVGSGVHFIKNYTGGAGRGADVDGNDDDDDDITEMSLDEFKIIYNEHLQNIDKYLFILIKELSKLLVTLRHKYCVKEYALGIELLRLLFKKHKQIGVLFDINTSTADQQLLLSGRLGSGIPDNYCLPKKTLCYDRMDYLHDSRIIQKSQDWIDYGIYTMILGIDKYDIVEISKRFKISEYDTETIAKYYFQYMGAIIINNIETFGKVSDIFAEFEKDINDTIKAYNIDVSVNNDNCIPILKTAQSSIYKKLQDIFTFISRFLDSINEDIKNSYKTAKAEFNKIDIIALLNNIKPGTNQLADYTNDARFIEKVSAALEACINKLNEKNKVHNTKHEIIYKKLASKFPILATINDDVDDVTYNKRSIEIASTNNPNELLRYYYDDIYKVNDARLYNVTIKPLSVPEIYAESSANAGVSSTSSVFAGAMAAAVSPSVSVEDKEIKNPIVDISITSKSFILTINDTPNDFSHAIKKILLHPKIAATKMFYILHKMSELYKIRFIVLNYDDNNNNNIINNYTITPAFFSNAVCKSTIYLKYNVKDCVIHYINFCEASAICSYRNEIIAPTLHGLFRYKTYANDMYNIASVLKYNDKQKLWIRANLGKFMNMGSSILINKNRTEHLDMLQSQLSKIDSLLGINYIMNINNPKFVQTFFEIILYRFTNGYADYFAVIPDLKLILQKIARLVPNSNNETLPILLVHDKTLYQLFCITFDLLGIVPNLVTLKLKEDLSLYLSDYSKTKIDHAKELKKILTMESIDVEYEEYYDDQYAPKYSNSISKKLKLLLGDKYLEEDMDLIFSGDYRSKIEAYFMSINGVAQIETVPFINNYTIYKKDGTKTEAPIYYKVQLATELILLELYNHITNWPFEDLLSYYEKYIFTRYDIDIDTIMKTAIINTDYYICYIIIKRMKIILSADFLVDYFKLVELCYEYNHDSDQMQMIAEQFIN